MSDKIAQAPIEDHSDRGVDVKHNCETPTVAGAVEKSVGENISETHKGGSGLVINSLLNVAAMVTGVPIDTAVGVVQTGAVVKGTVDNMKECGNEHGGLPSHNLPPIAKAAPQQHLKVAAR